MKWLESFEGLSYFAGRQSQAFGLFGRFASNDAQDIGWDLTSLHFPATTLLATELFDERSYSTTEPWPARMACVQRLLRHETRNVQSTRQFAD